MTPAECIAYLRTISSRTLPSVSVYKLRQVADEMEAQELRLIAVRKRADELKTEVEDIMRKLNRGPL